MGITIKSTRYIPLEFLHKNKNRDDVLSPSEALAKAMISFVDIRINESQLLKGDAAKNEPDLVYLNPMGFEVTFADYKDKTHPKGVLINRLIHRENYHIASPEDEIMNSIVYSINEKFEKKKAGNYKKVPLVSVFVICLEPLFTWTRPELSSWATKKRDPFFRKLIADFISDEGFENIFLLQVSDIGTFTLFDLCAFSDGTDSFSRELNFDKKRWLLPYCSSELIPNEKSMVYGEAPFQYSITNAMIETRAPTNID